MILFVGSEESMSFTHEIVTEKGETIIHTGQHNHISDVVTKLVEYEYSHIIVDCDSFIDNYKTIAQHLHNAKTATKANIIILAVGYSLESELIQALAIRGFRNYVVSPLLATRKEQLQNAIDNVNSLLDNSPITQELEETSSSETQKTKITIAFGGSSARIGVTTQAIQYVKYLQFMGKQVCYIELGNKRFVDKISTLFGVKYEDETLGKLVYEQIPMFNKPQELENILKEPYDYFVYDFGSFTDPSFNLFSFIEKDIKVCVCGSKADEISNTNSLIERTYNNDVFYLFNFTAETDQKELLDFMEDKKDKTLFAEPCFDYFTYKSNSNNLYGKISPVKKTVTTKKTFFKWGKK